MSMFQYYPHLSSANQTVFRDSLTQWGRENDGKGVMLFDERSIRSAVQTANHSKGTDGIILNILPTGTKMLNLHGLTLIWRAEQNKAILLEVKVNEETIYTAPNGFFDACLWVGC